MEAALAYVEEHQFTLHDGIEEAPGVIHIASFPKEAGLTPISVVSIAIADFSGEGGTFLAQDWDAVDQIIDQLEIAAIKAFGDRPSVPETPNLLT